MNKKFIPFVLLCIVISIIPSVGMIFFTTTTTTENTTLAEAPKIVTADGSFNKLFFQDCGEYFNDHIALRNQMIFADAKDFFEPFEQSIQILLEGKVDYEFRTTVVNEFHKPNDIRLAGETIRGARRWFLQCFQ